MPKAKNKRPIKAVVESDEDSIPDLDGTESQNHGHRDVTLVSASGNCDDKIPNFPSMKIEQLKAILKNYGTKVSGCKAELVERANDFYKAVGHWEKKREEKEESDKKSSDFLSVLTEKRKIFRKSDLTWSSIDSFSSASIPDIEYQSISTFLTECHFDLGDESVSCGTEKPVTKGERMYKSEKIQLCEFTDVSEENIMLFRANMSASMKTSEIR